MNKGFEVIEACWLFGFAPSQVDVVIHPQSTVHAMIEYSDGSVLAQISATDMRMPIQYALTWPERWQAPVPKIDWSQARHWDFAPPDFDRFPLLKLAYQCQEAGGSATCTLNAADEIAVEAFLKGEIGFPGIAAVVEETLSRMPNRQPRTVGDILEIDKESRSWRASSPRLRAAGRRATGSGKGLNRMAFFQSVFWFMILIGVMILIHELGHFWAARFFDVRVDTFSFGFGPRLFGFRRGETDYRVSAGLLPGRLREDGRRVPGDETPTIRAAFWPSPAGSA
jgi:hypothetical protein